jgi:hypothetical protein
MVGVFAAGSGFNHFISLVGTTLSCPLMIFWPALIHYRFVCEGERRAERRAEERAERGVWIGVPAICQVRLHLKRILM